MNRFAPYFLLSAMLVSASCALIKVPLPGEPEHGGDGSERSGESVPAAMYLPRYPRKSPLEYAVSVHCCEGGVDGPSCPIDSSMLTPGQLMGTCDYQQASFLARVSSALARRLIEIAAELDVDQRKIVFEIESDGSIVMAWGVPRIDDEFAMTVEEEIVAVEKIANPPRKILVVAVIDRIGP